MSEVAEILPDDEAVAKLLDHLNSLGLMPVGFEKDETFDLDVHLINLIDELADRKNELALIAVALAEHGLAPEGDYNIAEATIANIGGYAEVRAEREQLQAELDRAKAALVNAEAKGKAVPKKRLEKVRAIAPIKLKKDETLLSSTELLELIKSAETVELAFSDGKSELAGIDPLVISGDAWELSLDRVKLNLPELIVHGPAFGKPAYALAGYGLLLDGELVAYSPRSDVLRIGASTSVNLKDDVIF